MISLFFAAAICFSSLYVKESKMSFTHLPEGYAMRLLDVADLNQIIGLQQTVIDHLSPERFHDISHRTKDDFATRMTALGRMFGVFVEKSGQLVGYSTLALANEDWPVCDLALPASEAPCPPHQLAVSQNSVVHPEHRGKGFHKVMLQAKLALCSHFSRRHVMAQLVNHNVESLSNLLRVGFQVTQASITPVHKCKGLRVHLDLMGAKALCVETTVVYVDAVKNYEGLKFLLDDGYRGVSVHRASCASQGWLLKVARLH